MHCTQSLTTFPRQANVTEFLDTEGLPKELGGEDDWQYSWQVHFIHYTRLEIRRDGHDRWW